MEQAHTKEEQTFDPQLIEKALDRYNGGQYMTKANLKELKGFEWNYIKKPEAKYLDGLRDYLKDVWKKGGMEAVEAELEEMMEEMKQEKNRISPTKDPERYKEIMAKLALFEAISGAISPKETAKTPKKEEAKNNLQQVFGKENREEIGDKTIENILNQVKWAVGKVLGWVGIKTSLTQPWEKHRAKMDAEKRADAESTVNKVREKIGATSSPPAQTTSPNGAAPVAASSAASAPFTLDPAMASKVMASREAKPQVPSKAAENDLDAAEIPEFPEPNTVDAKNDAGTPGKTQSQNPPHSASDDDEKLLAA